MSREFAVGQSGDLNIRPAADADRRAAAIESCGETNLHLVRIDKGGPVVATVMGSDLVGLKAFSREGAKLGKVKSVVSDDAETRDYLVIARSLRRDLVIPIDTVATPGDRVVVPHTSSFCDSAPRCQDQRRDLGRGRQSSGQLLSNAQ